MLNLVQLQERLKDVPMQALMKYANGANPQIPPFLALGELNRRKKMQENAASEQAVEMEGAPTVKEQIEQAAGLLALQGNRQQQAARQQAGVQAAMPMAAPNTTTSEPAQLAGGGFIDDIVVPRDYQRGGMVNPDMMKRLMMMKAMQNRRPGVAGLPMRQDMFKRGDYAGGGIVAFNGTFDSFVQETSPRGDAKEREATREEKELMTLAELQEYNRSGKIPDRVKAQPAPRRSEPAPSPAAPSAAPPSAPSATPQVRATPSSNVGLPAIADAARTYLGINPLTALPELARKRPEIFARELDEFNKAFGVSGDPFKELKRRLGEVESEDKRTRADQPMDQLTRFLTSVATGPRGGTFGTQGAVGAKASSQLRAEQIALNRKQDLDMAALQGAITEKEEAIARGDRDKAMAADQKIVDYNNNLAKDRLAIQQKQAEIANQATQAAASARQASRPTQTQELTDLLLSTDPRKQEAGRILAGASRTGEITDSTLLNQWNDLSIIDKQRLAKLQPPVLTFNDYKNYIRNSQGTTGATGAGVGGVTVRLPDGRTATFPDQAAADKFKKDAGIK